MNTDGVRGHNSPQLRLYSSSRYFWYGGCPHVIAESAVSGIFHLDSLAGAASTMPRLLSSCLNACVEDIVEGAHRKCWGWKALLHLCKPNEREGGSLKENIYILA